MARHIMEKLQRAVAESTSWSAKLLEATFPELVREVRRRVLLLERATEGHISPGKTAEKNRRAMKGNVSKGKSAKYINAIMILSIIHIS